MQLGRRTCMCMCYLWGEEQFTSVVLGGAVLRLHSFCHLKNKTKLDFPSACCRNLAHVCAWANEKWRRGSVLLLPLTGFSCALSYPQAKGTVEKWPSPVCLSYVFAVSCSSHVQGNLNLGIAELLKAQIALGIWCYRGWGVFFFFVCLAVSIDFHHKADVCTLFRSGGIY